MPVHREVRNLSSHGAVPVPRERIRENDFLGGLVPTRAGYLTEPHSPEPKRLLEPWGLRRRDWYGLAWFHGLPGSAQSVHNTPPSLPPCRAKRELPISEEDEPGCSACSFCSLGFLHTQLTERLCVRPSSAHLRAAKRDVCKCWFKAFGKAECMLHKVDPKIWYQQQTTRCAEGFAQHLQH